MCTKMSGLKFDFSKIFWGGAHRAPSPDPSPRFFSGFALGSGFALNSRALRALDSGFALDTRALRALDSGFVFNFRLGTLVWPPPKKIPGSAPDCDNNVLLINALQQYTIYAYCSLSVINQKTEKK